MMKKKKFREKNRLFEITTGLAVVGGTIMLAAPSLAANPTVTLTAANQFDQPALTVSEGETVTFSWAGGFHDVTFADGVGSGAPVGIEGTTFARRFDAAGTFNYICSVHVSSGMTGTVTVEAGSTATTVAATATTVAASGGTTATTVAASGGATGSSGGSTTARSQPFTGPEDSMLPMAGLALVLGGLGIRFRLRRAG